MDVHHLKDGISENKVKFGQIFVSNRNDTIKI